MRIAKIFRKAALALALALAPFSAYAASILPQGVTQFLDNNGNPLSAGSQNGSMIASATLIGVGLRSGVSPHVTVAANAKRRPKTVGCKL